jgi:hypothetical protein
MDSEDTYPIIHPTSIEEPTSPDLSGLPLSGNEPNDIKMKSQSWYEPEKDRMSPLHYLMTRLRCLIYDLGIVITDLDDSDDEAESDTPVVDISTALLDRIKDPRTLASVSIPFPSTSTALVLFRPLPFGSKEVADDDEPADVKDPPDDCAMDVEP